jgi:tetratricopeptide (TPR) repeat protein
MEPLPHPNNLHLQAAQGWLELGNRREADAELHHIAAEYRSHPEVLEIRWQIHALEKEWEKCADIAALFIRVMPGHHFGWIHRSYALHELKQTQAAYDNLAGIAGKFAGVWTIPYNLACYCSQLGRLDEAQAWFNQALAIDPKTVKEAGLQDPDLQPLWAFTGGQAGKS